MEPAPLEQPGLGLLVSTGASVLNLAVGVTLGEGNLSLGPDLRNDSILCRRGDLNAGILGDKTYQCVPICAGQSWFSLGARPSQYPQEPPWFIAFADNVMTSRTPE